MKKLQAYRTKRQFKKTPEPKPKVQRSQGGLLFTIQKHAASHLHYDLRLEVDGVLKSWAVPKGPTLNPADKRLAIRVEDHPYDYHAFEGIIPEGNYGAGTVMVWDTGTYTVPFAKTPQENEKLAAESLKKGRFTFILKGKKLQGEFSLVDLKHDNQWLLIKKRDAFAEKTLPKNAERSVKSGRTMEEIAANKKPLQKNPQENDHLQQAPKGLSKNKMKHLDFARQSPVAASPNVLDYSLTVPKKAMPRAIQPMLAVLVDKPFDRKGWLFEIKWDGYRAIAYLKGNQVKLFSRNQKSYNERFPEIVQELKQLSADAVLDGEIVILDKQGKPQFQWLQQYPQKKQGIVVYYVFDLLYLNGHDLRGLPLIERKALLKTLLPISAHAQVRFNDHVEERGVTFFKKAVSKQLEGIMGKDGASTYVTRRSPRRSPSWVKIKTHLRQEVVIGGFTQPRGSRKKLGALLVGVYEKGEWVYVGHVGGGFTEQSLADVYKKLQPLVRSTSPFKKPPKPNMPVTWVQPKLVCEVVFAEWTAEGIMRQPIFKGMRTDKKSKDVIRETPKRLKRK